MSEMHDLKGTIFNQKKRIAILSKELQKTKNKLQDETKFTEYLERTNKDLERTIKDLERTITEKYKTITKKDKTISKLISELKITLSGAKQDCLIRVMLNFEGLMVEKYEKELSELVSREKQLEKEKAQFEKEKAQFEKEIEEHNKKILKERTELRRENKKLIAIEKQNYKDKMELFSESKEQKEIISGMIKNFEEDIKRQLTHIDSENEEITRKNKILTKEREKRAKEIEQHAEKIAAHAKEIEKITREKEAHVKIRATHAKEIEELTRKIEELEETFTTKVIKPEFRCPITTELMTDPVITSNGHTYERSSIKEWFCSHDTDPNTNVYLANKNLIPNIALRKLIEEIPR